MRDCSKNQKLSEETSVEIEKPDWDSYPNRRVSDQTLKISSNYLLSATRRTFHLLMPNNPVRLTWTLNLRQLNNFNFCFLCQYSSRPLPTPSSWFYYWMILCFVISAFSIILALVKSSPSPFCVCSHRVLCLVYMSLSFFFCCLFLLWIGKT